MTDGRDVYSVYARYKSAMLTEREIIESCACHRARTARVVTRAYDEVRPLVGLRTTQLSVLLAVAADDAMSITALAKFMGMDRIVDPQFASAGKGRLDQARGRRLASQPQFGDHQGGGRARLRAALPLWNKAQQALKKKLGDRAWADVRASLDHLIRTA